MAQTYSLDAEARTITGKKVSQLRRQGLVPGVIYGVKTEPVHIQMPTRTLQHLLLQAGGTRLIDINVAGNPFSVLAREVQRDILRGDILHVDFIAVDASATIAVDVPVHFTGEAPAEKAGLGILLHGVTTLTIEALPADLIDSIQVDLSSLKEVGDSIFVRDLQTGDKVKITNDPEEMVVKIVMTAAGVSESAEEGEEASEGGEPEVVGRGKREEEEDED